MKLSQSWVHEAQHGVFRGVSLVFSVITAHAIFWFFSVLNGVDVLQRYVTVATAVAFALLGYFVTRGFAHRLMKRQRVRSYIVIGILYVLVEVVCNYGEAAARFPDMTWIRLLHGWQLSAFSLLAPFVLSIIPFFNLCLAYIDVDLMIEKEARVGSVGGMGMPQGPAQGLPSKVSPAFGSGASGRPVPSVAAGPVAPAKPLLPKQPSVGPVGTGATQVLGPQPSYPSMPVPVAPVASGSSARGPLAGSFNGVRPQGSV